MGRNQEKNKVYKEKMKILNESISWVFGKSPDDHS